MKMETKNYENDTLTMIGRDHIEQMVVFGDKAENCKDTAMKIHNFFLSNISALAMKELQEIMKLSKL